MKKQGSFEEGVKYHAFPLMKIIHFKSLFQVKSSKILIC